jgi:kynureninase
MKVAPSAISGLVEHRASRRAVTAGLGFVAEPSHDGQLAHRLDHDTWFTHRPNGPSSWYDVLSVPTARARALALDDADPLAPCRELFALPESLIYLNGNSLGALALNVPERVADVVAREWGNGLVGSWDSNGWWDAPVRVGDRIGRLVGAAPGEVVVTDSTTVNVFKLASAARRLRPDRRHIVMDPNDFPTDRYVARAVAEGNIATTLDDDTAVVVSSHVDYRSGAMKDIAGATAEVHEAGALVLWDLSHSIGAVPLDLHYANVDLAVGCTYKYLNGGPGSPAFCFVASRLQHRLLSPIPGWVGHARPFEMEAGYEPDPGIRRMLTGTPPILALAALDAALDVFDGVSLDDLRAKSLALADLFITLVDERLADTGVAVGSPREPSKRGSHVSLVHPSAGMLVDALCERGVIVDFRPPDVARFGFAPLYIRFVDVWDAVDHVAAVLLSA